MFSGDSKQTSADIHKTVLTTKQLDVVCVKLQAELYIFLSFTGTGTFGNLEHFLQSPFHSFQQILMFGIA